MEQEYMIGYTLIAFPGKRVATSHCLERRATEVVDQLGIRHLLVRMSCRLRSMPSGTISSRLAVWETRCSSR